MNCKTCKYWIKGHSGLIGVKSKEPLTTGACSRIDLDDGSPLKGSASIAADASDDSGLSASLVTSESFGCVLHEGKFPELNTFPDWKSIVSIS